MINLPTSNDQLAWAEKFMSFKQNVIPTAARVPAMGQDVGAWMNTPMNLAQFKKFSAAGNGNGVGVYANSGWVFVDFEVAGLNACPTAAALIEEKFRNACFKTRKGGRHGVAQITDYDPKNQSYPHKIAYGPNGALWLESLQGNLYAELVGESREFFGNSIEDFCPVQFTYVGYLEFISELLLLMEDAGGLRPALNRKDYEKRQRGPRKRDTANALVDAVSNGWLTPVAVICEEGWTETYDERAAKYYVRRPASYEGEEYSEQSGNYFEGCLTIHSSSVRWADTEHNMSLLEAYQFSGDFESFDKAAEHLESLAAAVVTKGELPTEFPVRAWPAELWADIHRRRKATLAEFHGSEYLKAIVNVELPADFWETRPELKLLLAAARYKMASPAAVLLAFLNHILACTPPNIQLPGTIGGPQPLNMLSIFLGDSSAGKGMIFGTLFSECFQLYTDYYRVTGIGSGEGIVDQYRFTKSAKEYKEELEIWQSAQEAAKEGAEVKPEHRRKPQRHGWIAKSIIQRETEITKAKKLDERKGTTLNSAQTKAWSGEDLSTANRDSNNSAPLPPMTYRYQAQYAAQVENLGMIFEEANINSGFAARWIWTSAYDRNADKNSPIPPTLVEWDWEGGAWDDDDTSALYMEYPAEVTDKIRSMRELSARGAHAYTPEDRLNGHLYNDELRVASAFCLWRTRGKNRIINDEDMRLAKHVMDLSNAVRENAMSYLAELAQTKDEAGAVVAGHKDAIRAMSAADVANERLALRIGRIINKHGEMTRNKLLKGYLNDNDKERLSESIEYGEVQGWVVQEIRKGSNGKEAPYIRLGDKKLSLLTK